MKENFSGINRVYSKDRFMYEVYVDGKLISTKLTSDDAIDLYHSEIDKKKKKQIDFKVALSNILDEYKVNMKMEYESILVTFDDDVTPPFFIDGKEINSEVINKK